MNITGLKTRSGKPSMIKMASPDSPIYKTGYMIGVRRLKKSSKGTPKKTPTKLKIEQSDKAHLKRLERLEKYIFDEIEDIKFIKSYWISRRAEEMAEEDDSDDLNDELREEGTGMEWFANYESKSIEDLIKDNDPLLFESFDWFENKYKS